MSRHGTRLRERLVIALLALSAGLAPAAGLRAETGGTIRVVSDRGGLLGERSATIRRLAASGQRVELLGDCFSACTMYLGLPNACVSPGATFVFHGPSWYGQPLPPAEFEHWSQVMARNYREPLRSWFLSEARYTLRGSLRKTGAELIRMGYPRC